MVAMSTTRFHLHSKSRMCLSQTSWFSCQCSWPGMPCRLPHYFDMEKINKFFHTRKHIIYYNDLTYKKKVGQVWAIGSSQGSLCRLQRVRLKKCMRQRGSQNHCYNPISSWSNLPTVLDCKSIQQHQVTYLLALTLRNMLQCSFHLVPHFEECCSQGVIVNCEFIFFGNIMEHFLFSITVA